jgi:hypothetical protein
VRASILLAMAVALSATCWAADPVFDVKPGLWDINNTIQMSGMPPIPNLDQMSPEQRARIEGAMKNMSAAPHTTTVKSCVTKEGIEKALARASSNGKDACSPKLMNMSASKVTMHIDCTRESGMKTNGDITIVRQSADHFTGTGSMKSSSANGRTMDIKWSMTGTFVSSDCGSVKPSGQ